MIPVLNLLQVAIENLTHLPCYTAEVLIESPGYINCTGVPVKNVLKMIAEILLLNSRRFIKVTKYIKSYT